MLYLIKNEETQTETNYLAQAYTTTNGSRVSPKYQHIQTSEIYDAISSMGFQVTFNNELNNLAMEYALAA
jgi:hypothetical protein